MRVVCRASIVHWYTHATVSLHLCAWVILSNMHCQALLVVDAGYFVLSPYIVVAFS